MASRTAFRSESEQQSERSDADTVIVEQVFGIVKRDCPKRSGGTRRGLGVQGKGAIANSHSKMLTLVHSFLSSCGGSRFLRMDSPRISMR